MVFVAGAAGRDVEWPGSRREVAAPGEGMDSVVVVQVVGGSCRVGAAYRGRGPRDHGAEVGPGVLSAGGWPVDNRLGVGSDRIESYVCSRLSRASWLRPEWG